MQVQVRQPSSRFVEAEIILNRRVAAEGRSGEAFEAVLRQNRLKAHVLTPIDKYVEIGQTFESRLQMLVAFPMTVRKIRAMQPVEKPPDHPQLIRPRIERHSDIDSAHRAWHGTFPHSGTVRASLGASRFDTALISFCASGPRKNVGRSQITSAPRLAASDPTAAG